MTIEFMENPVNAEKVEAMSFLSDCYKDAYGIRPRGVYNVEAMTIDDINAEIDRVNVIVSDNMELEAIEESNADWEFQTLVEKTIKLGAGDEKTALKWLFDAHIAERNIVEVDYMDIEHFVWGYGIMFTEYGKRIINIVKQPYMNYAA